MEKEAKKVATWIVAVIVLGLIVYLVIDNVKNRKPREKEVAPIEVAEDTTAVETTDTIQFSEAE